MARCHVCDREAGELWARARDLEYGTTSETFSYWLCGRCDCLSIDPLPADRLAEIYPKSYYSFATAGGGSTELGLVGRVKARLDARTFRRVLSIAGASRPCILDIGGGTGEISLRLLDHAPGGSATVVDFDQRTIEVARSRGLEGFAGRFEDFESDDRFDVVLMLNLIEHVADPVSMLRKAGNLLRPGGVLWLQTPNFRSLDARLFRRRNWAGLHCPRHWVIFSEDGLRRAIGAAGLRSDRFLRTQGGYFWAASLLCLGRRLEPGAELTPPIESAAFPLLAAGGAGFDLITRPVRATSQVVVLARRADAA